MASFKYALWEFIKGFSIVVFCVASCIGGICLCALFLMDTSSGAGGRVDRAKYDVKSLETVVMAYKTRHDGLPNTLEELTLRDPVDNTPAPLTEKGMLDPWNNRYIYDPFKLHPKSGVPLIWTKGPPDGNKPIKNWE
jgi:Type II secretion system (T2SS), protein G